MIIDRPWAIVYGPKSKLGPGLMYGLGLTRTDAWSNAILVMYGRMPPNFADAKKNLQRRGMVARRVTVTLQ